MERIELSSIRLGKVTEFLCELRPSNIIPFHGNLPLVNPLDYDEFLTKVNKPLFVDLSDEVKDIVYKAERIKVMADEFSEWLNTNGVGINNFNKLGNDKKADILYEWMNMAQYGIGSLKI